LLLIINIVKIMNIFKINNLMILKII
jgi:hypothetical protein